MYIEITSMLQDLYLEAHEAGSTSLYEYSLYEYSNLFVQCKPLYTKYSHILHADVHCIVAWLCGFHKAPIPRFAKDMQKFSILVVSSLTLNECSFLESRTKLVLEDINDIPLLLIMEDAVKLCMQHYIQTDKGLHDSLRQLCLQHILSAIEKRKMVLNMDGMQLV
jgi:hypothetical protein